MPVIRTKPGAKRTTATKAKPARATARRGAPAKRQAAKPAAKRTATRTNRSPKTDLPKSQINATLNPLAKAGTKRKQYEEQWREHVAETNRLIVEALDKEIPVNMIVEAAQVSRQHVYKIIADMQDGTRTANGEATGKAGRPPVKKTSRGIGGTKRSGSSTSRKAGTGRRAASTSGRTGQPKISGKPRIRTR